MRLGNDIGSAYVNITTVASGQWNGTNITALDESGHGYVLNANADAKQLELLSTENGENWQNICTWKATS